VILFNKNNLSKSVSGLSVSSHIVQHSLQSVQIDKSHATVTPACMLQSLCFGFIL